MESALGTAFNVVKAAILTYLKISPGFLARKALLIATP